MLGTGGEPGGGGYGNDEVSKRDDGQRNKGSSVGGIANC